MYSTYILIYMAGLIYPLWHNWLVKNVCKSFSILILDVGTALPFLPTYIFKSEVNFLINTFFFFNL